MRTPSARQATLRPTSTDAPADGVYLPPLRRRQAPDLPIVKGTPLQPAPQTDRTRLRDARHELGLSQQAFADLIQRIGEEMGEPNRCTKRLVQKWESGEHATITLPYRKAITLATGLNLADLFSTRDTAVFALRINNIMKDLATVLKEVIGALERGDSLRATQSPLPHREVGPDHRSTP